MNFTNPESLRSGLRFAQLYKPYKPYKLYELYKLSNFIN